MSEPTTDQRLEWDMARFRKEEEELKAKDHELSLLRDLVRSHEADRERAETYERYLTEIGRSIGCGHLDDRLPSCVTDVIEANAAKLALWDEMRVACEAMLKVIRDNSEFDDGAFYYAGRSASELEKPTIRLDSLLAKCNAIDPK